MGFPCGSTGKESACNAGDLGLIPELGISPGEGNGYPLQYSGLKNSMDCIVHGVAKSQTRLSNFHFQPEFCPLKILGSPVNWGTYLPTKNKPSFPPSKVRKHHRKLEARDGCRQPQQLTKRLAVGDLLGLTAASLVLLFLAPSLPPESSSL